MDASPNRITIRYRKKDSILIIVGVIVIFYSTYQTARGFKLQNGGDLQAWIFAIIIGLLLLYLALALARNLTNRKILNSISFFLAYLFVAWFSFSSNFNSFYSSSVDQDVLNKDIDSLELQASKLGTEIEKGFRETPEKVRLLQTTLVAQMLDVNNPGWGNRTDSIAKLIGNLLGVPITRQSGAPQQMVASVGDQISSLLKTREANLADIKSTSAKQLDDIKAGLNTLKDSTILPKKKKIKEYQTALKKICVETSTRLNDINNINCNYSDFSIDNIGQISFSFQHAKDNANLALMPLLQSALLDIVLPILILLSKLQKNTPGDDNFPGARDY